MAPRNKAHRHGLVSDTTYDTLVLLTGVIAFVAAYIAGFIISTRAIPQMYNLLRCVHHAKHIGIVLVMDDELEEPLATGNCSEITLIIIVLSMLTIGWLAEQQSTPPESGQEPFNPLPPAGEFEQLQLEAAAENPPSPTSSADSAADSYTEGFVVI